MTENFTDKEKQVFFLSSVPSKTANNLSVSKITETTLTLNNAERMPLSISVLDDEILHLTYGYPSNKDFATQMAMLSEKQLPVSASTFSINGNEITLSYSDNCFEMDMAGGVFRIRRGNETVLESASAIGHSSESLTFSLKKKENEHFSGLGLRTEYPLDGKELEHVSRYNHWEGKSVPFFISSAGFGLFLCVSRYGTDFDFSSDDTTLSIPGGDYLNLYIFTGSPLKILKSYASLTGYPIMPPKWSLGYWHGKYGYRTQEETEEVVRKFREKKIPLDLLFLDLHWRGAYSALEISSLEWDLDCFPEPRKMLKRINDEHVHVFGHMNTSCNVAYRDFSNPDHIAHWRKTVPPIIKDGFEGCMVDAGEGLGLEGNYNFMPWNIPGGVFYNGVEPRDMANIWGLMYNRTAIGAMQSGRPDRRIFGLSRTATAGSQRYSLIWSGDHNSTWQEFDRELAGGLEMSSSGLPFWTYDIGGIEGMPSKELFARWFEAALFTPVMRTHGRFSREPWLYGQKVEAIVRKYLDIRMCLVPYLYSLVYLMHTTMEPIVKPLSFLFPEDEKAALIWDEWIFGNCFLVAPVHKRGAIEREVYFPEGKWISMGDGKCFEGGKTFTVQADLDVLPVFIKSGSLFAWGEKMQYVDEKKTDCLNLELYPEENGTYLHYEDNGLDNSYLEGEYTLRRFSYTKNKGRLVFAEELIHEGYSGYSKQIRLSIHCQKTDITVPENVSYEFV